MLSLRNLQVNYDSFMALHDISLDVEEGEIVALLGSNGAGKTTTINTVSGMTQLQSGRVIFQGQDISALPAFRRVQMGIVQVPEGRKLFPDMTVLDNLIIGSYVPEAKKRRKENLAKCFSIFPKLYERQSQKAGLLSGGEQQMCAMARGLMASPRLLMMDEPSLGLAPVIVDQMFAIIEEINRELRTTILLVEQNVARALEIANRGYVIETGRSALEGTHEELLNNEELKKAYLGI